MKGLLLLAAIVCGFCNSKYVPSYLAQAMAVVMRSLDARALGVGFLTIVIAPTALTLSVGVVVVLAAVGNQHTVKPFV